MSIIRKIKTAIAYSPLFKAYADILVARPSRTGSWLTRAAGLWRRGIRSSLRHRPPT